MRQAAIQGAGCVTLITSVQSQASPREPRSSPAAAAALQPRPVEEYRPQETGHNLQDSAPTAPAAAQVQVVQVLWQLLLNVTSVWLDECHARLQVNPGLLHGQLCMQASLMQCLHAAWLACRPPTIFRSHPMPAALPPRACQCTITTLPLFWTSCLTSHASMLSNPDCTLTAASISHSAQVALTSRPDLMHPASHLCPHLTGCTRDPGKRC